MTRQNISIIGAGGHTRSLLEIIDLNQFKVEGIYDDSFQVDNHEVIKGIEVKGIISDIPKDSEIIVAFGDLMKRRKYINQFSSQLATFNFYHESSIIQDNVKIGGRNQFFARTFLNSNIEIGDDNIINSGSIIEHETIIGSNNHISIGAILCGRVKIGDNCFIGAGAVVKDKVEICNGVTIGANSLVLNDILEPGVYVGNPIRKIK